MDQDKWENIKAKIKENFTLEDEGFEHIDDQGGVDVKWLVFESPLGRIKFEYVIKPVILDKKTTYSNRIGSETKVDYVYSQTEKSHQLLVFKWLEEDDDWEEMDAKKFSI